MFERILVPLDGSPLGERALPIARYIARAAGAEVVLIHASTDFDESMLVDAPVLEVTSVRERIDRIMSEAYLSQIAGELREEGIRVTALVRPGSPVEVILDTARAQRAHLIVLATRGRGGLDRWLYGSVADQVLREATRPVMLVPPASDCSWPIDRPLRILVPLDGSGFAEEALGPARELTSICGGKLILVRVAEPPLVHYYRDAASIFGYEVIARTAYAQHYLEMMAGDPRKRGGNVVTRSRVGEAASEIIATAHEANVDLIVMATHGRGGLARVLLGSVAAEVLRRAETPVMLIRPAALRTGTETASEIALASPLATSSAE